MAKDLSMTNYSKVIKSKDGVSEYPVDFIREHFINSEHTIEELAIQLNLSVEEVQHHAKRGLTSWYELKKQNLPTRLKYFMDVNIDNLTETHSLLEEGHFLMLIQMKDMQKFLKGYYAKNGHLFRMTEDGEISLDSYGMPIPLPLPNGIKHFMNIEGFLRLKETTKTALNQVYEQAKEETKTKVIDVGDTGIFDESND